MIPVYRNVDSPNGDFGLTRQEGDEEFVVLTKAEYAALCPVTSPGAHGEGEAVTLWRWPHNQREFFAPIPDAKQPHLGNAKMPMGCVVYTALPAAEFDALLARANTAKVLLKEARYFVDLFADGDAVDLLSRIDDALGEG